MGSRPIVRYLILPTLFQRNTDPLCVETPGLLLKRIFPRQFGLPNVFATDILARPKGKTPVLLKAVLKELPAMLANHQRYDYRQKLNHFCPSRVRSLCILEAWLTKAVARSSLHARGERRHRCAYDRDFATTAHTGQALASQDPYAPAASTEARAAANKLSLAPLPSQQRDHRLSFLDFACPTHSVGSA